MSPPVCLATKARIQETALNYSQGLCIRSGIFSYGVVKTNTLLPRPKYLKTASETYLLHVFIEGEKGSFGPLFCENEPTVTADS